MRFFVFVLVLLCSSCGPAEETEGQSIKSAAPQWEQSFYQDAFINAFVVRLPVGATLPEHLTSERIVVTLSKIQIEPIESAGITLLDAGNILYRDDTESKASKNTGAEELSYMVIQSNQPMIESGFTSCRTGTFEIIRNAKTRVCGFDDATTIPDKIKPGQLDIRVSKLQVNENNQITVTLSLDGRKWFNWQYQTQ